MKFAYSALLLLALNTAAFAQDPDGCAESMPVEGVPWDMELDDYGNVHVAGRAGIYTSCDNGDDWSASEPIRAPSLSVHASYPNPDVIFFGTDHGIYKSSDRGFGFLLRGQSIDGQIYSITSDSNGRLYAGATSGVYASDDSGETWALLESSPAGNAIQGLLVSPDDPNVIYAGTNGDGVFRSLDAGVSWEGLSNGQSGWQVKELVIDPGNSSILLAASWDGIWRSVDGGSNWSRIASARTIDLAFDPTDPLLAYAISWTDGILRSTDGGNSWVSTGDTALVATDLFYSIVVTNDGSVLAGAEFLGVFKSDDNGETWRQSGQAPAPPAPPAPPASDEVGSASLSMGIAYLGDDESIPAGQRGRFRITIRNNGPDPATNTEVQLSWFRSPTFGSITGYDFTATPSQGSCIRSLTPEPDCRLGTIRPGDFVEILLSGSTESGKLGWYTLRASALAPEGGISGELSIGTSVTLLDSDSGGGGMSWILILVLGLYGSVARVSRFRRTNPETVSSATAG